MSKEIKVPTLGESVTEGTIGEWLKQPGDAVAVDHDPAAFNSNLTLAGDGDFIVKAPLNLQDGQASPSFGDLLHTGAGVARFQDTLYAERLEGVGGGTLWMDQSGDSPVIAGPELSTLHVDNGSIVRRDFNETISGASLELGAGGGGISVADGFTLTWDSPITGGGDFTKEGEGTLRFPATAPISYTGSTWVKAGNLDVLSRSPTSASCSGSGTSNLCSEPIPNPEPEPAPEPVPDPDPAPVTDPGPDLDPSPETGPDPVPASTPVTATDPDPDPNPNPGPVLEPDPDPEPEKPAQQSLQGADRGALDTGDADISAPPSAQPQSGESNLVVDLANDTEKAASQETNAPSKTTSTSVPADQASDQLNSADQAATSRTASVLGLGQANSDLLPATPRIEELKTVLAQLNSRNTARSQALLN